MPKVKFYNLQVSNILLNLSHQEVHPDSTEYVVLPSMGKNACFLGPKWSTLLYLHVITGLLNSLVKKLTNKTCFRQVNGEKIKFTNLQIRKHFFMFQEIYLVLSSLND